jgi:very-short-patch-repair endonuclease
MDMQKQKWLLQRAKELRRNQTPHEGELWRLLRAKRFGEKKFYRQFIIGSYIVDFCCPKEKLVIELDGSGHTLKEADDLKRDLFLREQGYRIVRIWNSEWNTNRGGVIERLASEIEKPAKGPSPGASRHPPPANGGRGVH